MPFRLIAKVRVPAAPNDREPVVKTPMAFPAGDTVPLSVSAPVEKPVPESKAPSATVTGPVPVADPVVLPTVNVPADTMVPRV